MEYLTIGVIIAITLLLVGILNAAMDNSTTLYFKIKKGFRYNLRIPRLVGKPSTGKVKLYITESMLYTDSTCDPGVEKIFGHFWIHPHWNSWRIGYRINKELNLFQLVLYCYVGGKSPQDGGIKKNIASFDLSLLKYHIVELGGLYYYEIMVDEIMNRVVLRGNMPNIPSGALLSPFSELITFTTPRILRWLRFEARPNLKCKQDRDITFMIDKEKLY